MHRAWSSIVVVPYCFFKDIRQISSSHGSKNIEFYPNWAFPDCNSSLNSPMAMKCCTKLETAKERYPIVFQCHPSNFKVTRYKTSPILTQIGRFRTFGHSQLSNPSDLPCYNWFFYHWNKEVVLMTANSHQICWRLSSWKTLSPLNNYHGNLSYSEEAMHILGVIVCYLIHSHYIPHILASCIAMTWIPRILTKALFSVNSYNICMTLPRLTHLGKF